jgi:hypothetical protein
MGTTRKHAASSDEETSRPKKVKVTGTTSEPGKDSEGNAFFPVRTLRAFVVVHEFGLLICVR